MENKKYYMIATDGPLYKVVEVSGEYTVIKGQLSFKDADALLTLLRK